VIASALLDDVTGTKHPRNPAPHSCIPPAVSVPHWARCGWLTACRVCKARRSPGWKTAPGPGGPESNPFFIANNDLFKLGIGSFYLKACRKGSKGWRSAGSCAWYGDKGQVIMANRVHPTLTDADNSSGSFAAACSDWRSGDADSMSARTTSEPTSDAEWSTAGASPTANISVSFLPLGGSPYTPC